MAATSRGTRTGTQRPRRSRRPSGSCWRRDLRSPAGRAFADAFGVEPTCELEVARCRAHVEVASLPAGVRRDGDAADHAPFPALRPTGWVAEVFITPCRVSVVAHRQSVPSGAVPTFSGPEFRCRTPSR